MPTPEKITADLERCIETTRQYRDELFSRTPHPEERGVKLGISDQVLEEVFLYAEAKPVKANLL